MTAFMKHSYLLLALCAIVSSCGQKLQPTSSSVKSDTPTEVGVFRGVALINTLLKERLFEPGATFRLGNYLVEGGSSNELETLMGAFSSINGNSTYRNGTPNAVNSLLWHLSFYGFSKHIAAATCGADGMASPLAFTENAKSILKPFCQWPDAGVKNEDALRNLWLLFMEFDAPPAEAQAFVDFAMKDLPADVTGQEALYQFTMAIIYNPHFLLNK